MGRGQGGRLSWCRAGLVGTWSPCPACGPPACDLQGSSPGTQLSRHPVWPLPPGLGQLGPGTSFQGRLLASATHQVSSLHLVLPLFGGTWGAQGVSVEGLRFRSDVRAVLTVPKPGPGCQGTARLCLLGLLSFPVAVFVPICPCSGRPPTHMPSDGCHCRPAVGAGTVGAG